ncbi:hypothetical protein RD792_000084 [Penstemon davidsonii]|uniref:Caffeic acid O-methyltransferase n=1 Tax=Penstemon davidsonii TaxID=160366 RepID=A0ABR0DU49_9LAMI|nr:hypothetical protein RD792_000084 [Penstemon davidsonii]
MEEEDCLYAMQLVGGLVLPMVLKSAIELDLLELIKKAGPNASASASELASQLQTNNPNAASMIDRILRLLSGHSILNCSLETLPDGGGVERRYSLAPVCKFLTKNEDGFSVAPLSLMNHDKVLVEICNNCCSSNIASHYRFEQSSPLELAFERAALASAVEGSRGCRMQIEDQPIHAPVSDLATTPNPQTPKFEFTEASKLIFTLCHLKDAVLEGGIPFNRAYGRSLFEYTATDSRFNQVFNKAMSEQSTISVNKILESYKGFDGLKSIVDVGGGIGSTLNKIISKYPSIKGINFDLPHVVKDAPSYKGVEHIGGDMFVSVPKADAIFMKWICHDWSDEHCKKLLKNCYESIPENGKVIIAESVLPEMPNSGLSFQKAAQVDIIMMAYTPGGKERTEKEYEALAKAAGFKQLHKVCCAFNIWIMELYK